MVFEQPRSHRLRDRTDSSYWLERGRALSAS
jgi:hypothetical protein